MVLRFGFFYGVRGDSSNGVLQVGLTMGFLVGWGLRYRLLRFGGLGLKSWIGFFGEVGDEALVVMVWALGGGAWLESGDGQC